VIHAESQNDVAVIICKKKFADEEMGRELSSTFASLLGEGRYKTFLVDISGVEHANSMFLGALVGASHRVETHGCRFVVCGMQPAVKNVLTMTKCLITWEVHDDCKEARSTLGFD
jgi:anti-anti-sigma factor